MCTYVNTTVKIITTMKNSKKNVTSVNLKWNRSKKMQFLSTMSKYITIINNIEIN